MHSHDCSRPGLVQLRLLALHNQTRHSTFRTGRDDRSQKFTSRFSHRFRSRRLVEEIPARPARSNQSRGVPPGWLSKNKVVLSVNVRMRHIEANTANLETAERMRLPAVEER